jgi:ABC-type sugar transport system substrate-binding protein
MRRVQAIAGLSALAMTAVLSGCGTDGGADGAKVINIAYSVDVLDDTQNTVLNFVQERVDQINAERDDIEVKLDVYDAQSSVDKQISDVQSALIKQPDVLIFSAVDATGSLPAAQAAHDAGVPILDRRPTDPEADVFDVAFHGSDEALYSGGTVDWIKQYLEANPDVTLNAGVIYGAPAQTAQLVRIDAIKDLAEQMPDRLKIVAEGYGNWLTDTAQNLTQDWLQAHPEINYVACANDIMALGASNAVDRAGRSDDVLISGYDLTDDGLQRISEGKQALDVGVALKDYAQMVDVAVDMALGKFKDDSYTVEPVNSVTADNVDEFLKNS